MEKYERAEMEIIELNTVFTDLKESDYNKEDPWEEF